MGCFSADAPEPRNAAAEGSANLQAQISLAPQQYAAESIYRPKYAQLDMDTLARIAPQYLSVMSELQPQVDRLYNDSANTQRESDISAVERYGPRAAEAMRAINPDQTALLSALNDSALNDPAQSELSTLLGEQAISELNLGATLDPSLAREVSQATRSAQAARGQGYSTTNMVTEAMQRGAAAEELRRRRQAFAGQVDALMAGRTSAQRSNRYQVANINQTTTADPFMTILGRPSYSAGQSSGITGAGMNAVNGAAPRMFDPFSAYGADVANTNYNAQAAANISNANNRAALAAAGMKMVGSMAGGMGGAAIMAGCWVARELFGNNDPRWRIFREWLLNFAPAWFRYLYIRFGERFADWLRDKPLVKACIKPFFESRVRWMIHRAATA